MTSLFQAQRAVHLNTIPDQNGKTYLVTGGNTGIGYEVAKALAAKNAHVFMTSRNAEKQQGCVVIRHSFGGSRICVFAPVGKSQLPTSNPQGSAEDQASSPWSKGGGTACRLHEWVWVRIWLPHAMSTTRMYMG